jgi:phytoene dehydrogenase-like protein
MTNTTDRYDVIVIGAGHNGLTAAALLAKRGRRVVVLESRDVIGGMAASEQFRRGYRTAGLLQDTTGVRWNLIKELELGKHGLKLHSDPPSLYVPQMENVGLLLHHDPAKAAKEIGKFSDKDVQRYKEYRAFIGRVRGVIRRFTDRPPPQIAAAGNGSLAELLKQGTALRRLGKKDMLEVFRVLPMAVADWLNEWFETDLLKAALAGPAVYGTFMGPWSPGSAANLLLWESAAGPSVRGGACALVAALESAASTNGVEVVTGAHVSHIVTADGKVKGVRMRDGNEFHAPVVAASCDPKHTFLDLVARQDASINTERHIRQFRTRGTTAKVHIALNARLQIAGRPEERIEYLRTGENLDQLEKAFDAVKYGRFSERPVLDIHLPSLVMPDLAPEGHSVVSILAHFAPLELKNKWDYTERERLGEVVIDTLSQYATGMRSSIEGYEILTPADMEVRYGTSGGHIHHGEHALDQFLVRPSPECARYETPIKGLFQCGSGSHPGGGITCAPGALAARTIMRDRR